MENLIKIEKIERFQIVEEAIVTKDKVKNIISWKLIVIFMHDLMKSFIFWVRNNNCFAPF